MTTWPELAKAVADCRRCPLHKEATKKVFGVGDVKAPVVIAGEAPGENEDLTGEPFVGKAGKYLRKVMFEVGFRKGDVYICNVLKCRPTRLDEKGKTRNRPPSVDEVEACKDWFFKQMDLLKPKMVITLGEPATRLLIRDKRTMGGLRGERLNAMGMQVRPTWHPSYILQTHSALRAQEFEKDLRRAFKEVFPDRKNPLES